MNTTLYIAGQPVALADVARKTNELSFTLSGKTYRFRSQRLPDGSFLLERETAPGVWERLNGLAWQAGKERRVQVGNLEAKVSELAAGADQASGQGELSPPAPMPGLIRQILVKRGEQVKQGQPLAVMEAMKLQITLSAGGDAKVEEVLVKEGDMVTEGTMLVRLVAEKDKAA